MNYILFIISAVIILQASASHANPTVTGSTGLITVPSADTMTPGNACVGIWGDLSAADERHALVMPFGVTIGLGASWEVYGSYPNLLFNGQEDRIGVGAAELGTKYRVMGKRNSPYKFAVDLFGQRTISTIPAKEGKTNFGSRLIGSMITEKIGLHLYSGYMITGDDALENEVLYGAGLDLSPSPRSKIILELTGNTNRDPGKDSVLEGTVGLQYYLSPHLTLNVAGGVGFTSASPDWSATVGFTTCQGLGTYVKPVPRVLKPGEKLEEVVVKPVKIVPLTPLLMNAAAPAAPVSKLEVPVDPELEEIYVKPLAQVVIPAQTTAASTVTMPPLSAMASADKREKAPPVDDEQQKKMKELTGLIPAEPPQEEVLKDGETPLYGIDVKGDKLSIAAAKAPPNGERMSVYRKFRFPDVVYEYNQTEISADVKKSLSEVADLLRSDKKWSSIRIDAHTDGLGSDNYNMDLSLKRAITIATYLTVNEGIDPGRLFIKGMGKSKLIADNATTTGRKENRRFEILLLAPAEKK